MSGAQFPHLPAEAWTRYLEDTASPEATARMDAHLDECAACRTVAFREDPSRAFRRLRGLRVRPEAWDGFWEGIAAQIDAAPKPRRRPRWLAAVAAVAAAVLVAALAARLQPEDDAPAVIGTSVAGAADPCPQELAALHLTRQECDELRRPIEDEPVMILDSTLDLRGL